MVARDALHRDRSDTSRGDLGDVEWTQRRRDGFGPLRQIAVKGALVTAPGSDLDHEEDPKAASEVKVNEEF